LHSMLRFSGNYGASSDDGSALYKWGVGNGFWGIIINYDYKVQESPTSIMITRKLMVYEISSK